MISFSLLHRAASAVAMGLMVGLVLTACSGSGLDTKQRLSKEHSSLPGAYLQGRFAAQEFNIPKADNAFTQVAQQRPSLEGQRLAFAYALAAGSMQEAERYAAQVVDQPVVPEAGFQPGLQEDLPRLTLAAAAMRDGRFADAEQWLEGEMASLLGQSLGTLVRSALALETTGIEAASRVLADQPSGTFRGLVPIHAAEMFRLAGDTSAADAAYRQSLSAPRSSVAALSFARFLEDRGETEEAQLIYTRLLEDAGLYSRAGRMGLTRTGALQAQPKAFMRRAARQPRLVTSPRSLFAFAVENFAWLAFEQAASFEMEGPLADQARREAFIIPLALANIARSTDRERAGAHYIAAMVFAYFGNTDQAILAADAIVPESWLYTFAVLEKSSVLAGRAERGEPETEGLEAAVRVLRQAIQSDGGANPPWALQMMINLAALGKTEEADAYGTEAIKTAASLDIIDTARWRYHFVRGATRGEAGRWEDAKADLEMALQLAPSEPIILNHLGYSYVERGEQLPRAFAMIETALEQDPENGSIVDSLGWAHFQQGRFREAVSLLERAVDLEPADAVITDHLGDAYYMLGQDREARYEWRRVKTLDDADDELRAAVDRKLKGDFSKAPVLAARGNQAKGS
ncbi:MAG: hypothetical protein AAGG79_00625 [Pseudomonadota bacterium]